MTDHRRRPRAIRALSLAVLVIVLTSACGAASQRAAAGQTQQTDATLYLPLVTVRGAPPLANLLANAGFETGDFAGWSASGASLSGAGANGGVWAARLSNASDEARIEASVATRVGTTYKLTGWLRIVGETGSDWGGFRLALNSAASQEIAATDWLLRASRGSEWFKVALTFTATTPTTRVRAEYFGGPGRQMVVDVDDLMVFARQANQPPTISASLTPAAVAALPGAQRYQVSAEDADGAVVRVLWDFGDGTRALDAAGARRAALPGSYTATVRVADDDGAIAAQTVAWSGGSGAAPLAIDAPAAPSVTVSEAELDISGSAGAATTRVLVSTDRGFAGSAAGTSQWRARVPLQPGTNRILIQTLDGAGRIATAERLARYVPAGPLQIAGLAERAAAVERWDVQEITFALQNSAATHPQFPYDPAAPQGLAWADGVTADALFTPDGWQTVYRRPAFLNQRYQRALKQSQEWLYPDGAPIWTVRFAPPLPGAWTYRIEVREARGSAQSAERTFTATAPSQPSNRGPVRVSASDTRYFEHADGTPFLGSGHGTSFSAERFSYDATALFDTVGAGNQNFFRWWLGGSIWGSAWQPWRSRTLSGDGYLPATGLSLERAYGDGLASLKLDAANPIMFQGFDSGHAGLVPGRTYRARVRWRTEGVAGPASAARPYGATLKLVGWPEVGQTGSIPALIPHVSGDTPWHIAEADLVATGDFLPNLAVILENASAGSAYVDEIGLYEVLAGGALGPQLLRGPRANSHLTFDERRGAGVDAILAEATARGMFFKLVISEKSEYLLNHLGPDGLPDSAGGHFNRGDGTPGGRLHAYYWRHLSARFGAYRAVQSWELVNEAAPGPGEHFRLTAALATQASADGNPHPASTSTWATLAEAAWNDPASAAISYADFHAYVRTTGWIEPKDDLANDTARLFSEYDRAARAAGFGKPVVWGELGIDVAGNTDAQEPLLANDQQGVSLHKIVWARCGPGGVYPIFWHTNHIFDKSLHPIFGAWNRFMAGIPLTNGRYQDAAATVSGEGLRALGQKDTEGGRAHLWIDNRGHTWRAVVDGLPVAAVSGTVRVAMQRPGATYSVTWYNTSTGLPGATETRVADATGSVELSIAGLSSDTAVKLVRVGG